jgi:hypothetical protein
MKNIKKKIYQLLLIGGMAIATSGCSSDFLDVYNKGTVSPDIFPTSMAQLDLMLNAVYGETKTNGLYGFYWLPMGIYLYDHTDDLDWTAEADRSYMSLNHTGSTSSYIRSTYTEIFKLVELSNAVLEAVEGFKEKGYALPTDLPQLDYMKGQAYFFRALAYWHGQIYIQPEANGMAIPLWDHVPKSVEEMSASRPTTAEFWPFVISDLKNALTLLTGHNSDYTRPTEWAAKGLLAKVYAQSGDLASAKPILKDVIDNSGKGLAPYDTYKNMFFGESEYEYNVETIFDIDVTVDMQQWGPWGSVPLGSGMPMVFAPNFVNLADGSSIASGWSNNFVHEKNIYRFGFDLPPMSPSQFVNNPAYDAGKPKSLENLEKVPPADYVKASQDMRVNKTVDPRLFLSCGQPFIETVLNDDGQVTVYGLPPSVVDPEASKLQAWSHRKFTNLKGTEGAISMSSGANYPIVRMADLYLLYAETCAASEPNVALEYINKIHRRAYNYPPDSPSPVDYKSLTDRTMAQAGDHLANDPLKYERWAELFAEGQWWFDVCRWKIGSKEAAYYQKTRVAAIDWSDSYSYTQPIPKQELDRNKNMVQTPGY